MNNEKIYFENRSSFRAWLHENHNMSEGIWIIFSKNQAVKCLKANEALEEALCFGWIDGQIVRIDEDQYQKKFTQRRKKSQWSDKNKDLASKLIEKGLMTEAGLQAIKEAKRNGMWAASKKEPITDGQVKTLTHLLEGKELAFTNFMKMSPSVQRTYAAWYLDAKKEETKVKRLNQIVERLNENKKPM